MHIVHVSIHVKADKLEEFKAATRANAAASIQEPGIARFDFLQQADDPTHFMLVEVYRNADAPAAHKATEHYNRWRETVESLLAEPRHGTLYHNIHPDDASWD